MKVKHILKVSEFDKTSTVSFLSEVLEYSSQHAIISIRKKTFF